MFKCFLSSCCIWYLVSAHDHKFSHCAAANVSGGGADSMTTNFPYVQPTMECGDHHKIDQSFSPGAALPVAGTCTVAWTLSAAGLDSGAWV